jgi:uncharacterized protein
MQPMTPAMEEPANADPRAFTQPDRSLRRYYLLSSLLVGPGFPIAAAVLLCKYYTLRYRIDDEGIAMRYGVLFRREVYLTYRRIQDIHLTRNIVQRWMNLATLSVQTASGNASAEMTIEGCLQAEAMRDFLYSKMRGARGEKEQQGHALVGRGGVASDASNDGHAESHSPDRVLGLLTEIRDSLQQIVSRSS